MNGKMLCSSDSEPVRSAIAEAMPPMPTALSVPRPIGGDHAVDAAGVGRAEHHRDDEEEETAARRG